jgi:hypothetical protein
MNQSQKLIDEFLSLEAMAEQMRERSYRARVELERIYAPAPSGGRKKRALTDVQAARIVSDFRKSIIKKTSATHKN